MQRLKDSQAETSISVPQSLSLQELGAKRERNRENQKKANALEPKPSRELLVPQPTASVRYQAVGSKPYLRNNNLPFHSILHPKTLWGFTIFGSVNISKWEKYPPALHVWYKKIWLSNLPKATMGLPGILERQTALGATRPLFAG